MQGKKKGGTILLRDTPEGVVTDPKKTACERVGGLLFQFRAGEFFQNNPFILSQMVDHVVSQAREKNSALLVDAYCGVGLFSLCAAAYFERVVGIEISREGFEWARANALLNKIDNAEFLLGDASTIFEELESRRADWKPQPHNYNAGAIWRYAQTVGSAEQGAVCHPGAKGETHVYADI